MGVQTKLLKIQNELKAPKNQYNSFGRYKYCNCKDILEALKPILKEQKATIIINDEIVEVNGKSYIKANAVFTDVEDEKSVNVTAYAREEDNKKGMDASQITGCASSYARKYALNGLFAIDDTKDSDYNETTQNLDVKSEFKKAVEEYCQKNSFEPSELKIILSKKFGGDFKNLKSEDLIKMTKYLRGEKYE